MLQLMTKLGETSAYVVGHDWGASVAYTMANLAPDRVKKLLTIAIPHPRAINQLETVDKGETLPCFSLPCICPLVLPKKQLAYIDRIYKRWAPTWDIPAQQIEKMKEAYSSLVGWKQPLHFIGTFFRTKKTSKSQALLPKNQRSHPGTSWSQRWCYRLRAF